MKDQSISLKSRVASDEHTMQNPRVSKKKRPKATFNERQKCITLKSRVASDENTMQSQGLLKIKWPKATFNERQEYRPEVKGGIRRERNAEPKSYQK